MPQNNNYNILERWPAPPPPEMEESINPVGWWTSRYRDARYSPIGMRLMGDDKYTADYKRERGLDPKFGVFDIASAVAPLYAAGPIAGAVRPAMGWIAAGAANRLRFAPDHLRAAGDAYRAGDYIEGLKQHAAPFLDAGMLLGAGLGVRQPSALPISNRYGNINRLRNAYQAEVSSVNPAADPLNKAATREWLRIKESAGQHIMDSSDMVRYVESPARRTVLELIKNGKRPYSSNAYGYGEKGVWWKDKITGEDGFTPLLKSDF